MKRESHEEDIREVLTTAGFLVPNGCQGHLAAILVKSIRNVLEAAAPKRNAEDPGA